MSLDELPDFLRYRILHFLPIQSVVRTGVISRRWHRFWINSPYLRLYEEDFPDRVTFVDFWNRLFALRDMTAIRTMSIRCEVFQYAHSVSTWIMSAAQRTNALESLSLELANSGIPLPRALLICRTLRQMSLCYMTIHMTESLQCPPLLERLLLREVSFLDAATVERLLNSETLLDLTLDRCRWVQLQAITFSVSRLEKLSLDDRFAESEDVISYTRVIAIQALSLQRFHYNGSMINKIDLNCPNIVEAEISVVHIGPYERVEIANDNILQLLRDVRGAERLSLSGCFSNIDNRARPLGNYLPIQFGRLTTLRYEPINLSTEREGLLEVLRRSPNIESVEILKHPAVLYPMGFGMEDEEELPELKFENLRIIKFCGATSEDLLLLQWLLASSPALEQIWMVIAAFTVDVETLRENLLALEKGPNCNMTITYP